MKQDRKIIKILYLTNDLNNVNGITTHLFHLTRELLNKENIKIFIYTGSGNSIEKFKKLGINILLDEKLDHKNRSVINFVKEFLKILFLIHENKIDIIHSHNHYHSNLAQLIKRFSSVKTIQTNHGILPEIGRLKHFCADKYIAVNEHIKEYIIENNLAGKENIELIRCGMLVNNNLPKRNNEKIKIISSSRFAEEKGLDIYIKAIASLPEAYRKKADFYLAGTGELETELQNLNRELAADIIFTGNIFDMKETFNETDIFIFPSRSKSEGFPLSLVEAAFAKNLIITSNFYGLFSIFNQDEDGLVFKVDDHLDLAEKIKFALDNHEKIKLMVENFYNKAVNKFDIKKTADEIIKLYRECIEE